MTKAKTACSVVATMFVLALCPSPGKASESVSFKSGALNNETPQGKNVSGEFFKPEGSGPFATVMLLPHCGGAGSDNVRHLWPDFLMDLGYAVLTVDTFGPQGQSDCVGLDKQKSRPEQGRYAYGALDYLATRTDVNANRIAVLGFSEGAFAINSVIIPSHTRKSGDIDFKAAASYYGGCWGLSRYNKEDIPLLLIVPEHDDQLAPTCIALGNMRVDIEMHVLKGAYHGFDRSSTTRSYDDAGNVMQGSSSATKEAQELTKEFLNRYIGSLAGTGVKRKVVMSGDETRIALNDWLASNKQLCSKNADYFSESVKDHISELLSGNKIMKGFTISNFKMRRLYSENCP